MCQLKSLIMNGSPRERTLAKMVESLEKGLKKAGSEVTRRSVIKLDIQPCCGCSRNCMIETPGVCIQKDDMQSLLPLVAQSDILILATPVYLDGMTGPLKTFVDRLLPLLESGLELRDGRFRHPVREGVKRGKVALISACGFPEMETFDPLVAHVKAICRNLGREYAGSVLISRYSVRDQRQWDIVLEMMERAGTLLVKEGEIPEEITSKIHALISREELEKALKSN